MLFISLAAAFSFAPRLQPLLRLHMRSTACCTIESGPPDDLALEEIADRFVELRAHYRKTGEVEQQVLCRNMLATRIAELRVNRCRVGPSALHGNGLFATRDIGEGELITFYPGDALIIWKDGYRSETGDVGVIFGAHVPDVERDAIAVTQRNDYEITVTRTLSVVGDPKRSSDPAYLGHFANDASTCETPERQEAYEAECLLQTNARHVTVRWHIRECEPSFP